MSTYIRISREHKELLAQYSTAAVFLYGMLSVSEFVAVFNGYEEVHTTEEEAVLALTRLAKTDDVEYSVAGDIISGPEFQLDFEDYEEIVEIIRSHQVNKPRYVPTKEEFLRYDDITYREPKQPYNALKAYILKHKLTTRGEGLDGVDDDMLDLHEIIQDGAKTSDMMDYFTKRGYRFNGTDAVNQFAQLLMDVHNNTRMYINNGFTPHELFEKYERPNLKPLPKIGRNEPCPCGSGLKYKRCCGREQ